MKSFSLFYRLRKGRRFLVYHMRLLRVCPILSTETILARVHSWSRDSLLDFRVFLSSTIPRLLCVYNVLPPLKNKLEVIYIVTNRLNYCVTKKQLSYLVRRLSSSMDSSRLKLHQSRFYTCEVTRH